MSATYGFGGAISYAPSKSHGVGGALDFNVGSTGASSGGGGGGANDQLRLFPVNTNVRMFPTVQARAFPIT